MYCQPENPTYTTIIPLTVRPPFSGDFRCICSSTIMNSVCANTCAQRFRQKRLIATIRFSGQPKKKKSAFHIPCKSQLLFPSQRTPCSYRWTKDMGRLLLRGRNIRVGRCTDAGMNPRLNEPV